jgi:endonuclease III
MRNKSNPPRQPLSRRRPKAAAKSAQTRSSGKAVTRKARDHKPSRQPSRAKSGGKRVAPAQERAPEIYARLHALYPDAHCALDFRTPFQLLIATILSAQCTDKRVNMVTPAVFARYPDPEALAAAKPEELEEMIKSTGFFRSKTKSLIGMATGIDERHGGVVPNTMEELVRLPGVGRKTANVILGNAFDRNEGVVVDTHVTRLSQRLGLSRHTDAVKIEQDLMRLFPRDQWTLLAHLLIEHGRRICIARSPKCPECVLNDICPSSTV